MTPVIPDILTRIVETKREELAELRLKRAELERAAANRPASRDFAAALTAHPPAIIAEIKKASPSKGVLLADFDPPKIAETYASGGAAAMSVLTDRDYFQGGWEALEAARAAVDLPVIRKDFTIDELHVIEAAAHGADAILLIAAILTAGQMRRFRELAAELQMASLVEVHSPSELEAALASGAEIVGVNNRDLHSFAVRLETSEELAARIPEGIVKVAESGIHSHADLARLRNAGFDAFLVGEHLMKSADPAGALRQLRGDASA